MNLEKTWLYLKMLMAVGVICVCVSGSLFFSHLGSDLKQITTATVQTEIQVQQSLAGVQKDVDNIQVMANTTLFQAEEVLHHTDVYIATAQQGEKHQLQELDMLIAQTQTTIQGLDASQKTIVSDLDATLHQTNQTVQGLQPLTAQLTETTKSLQETVQLTQPILKNTNDILSHVNGISADAQTEVHGLVYPAPKPWYAKLWGVTKLALRMLTIPLK